MEPGEARTGAHADVHRPAAAVDRTGHGRDHGGRVHHLLQDPGRGPGPRHRGPQPEPADAGGDPGAARAQPAVPDRVRHHDEEALHHPGSGVLLQPGRKGGAGNIRGHPRDPVARLRRRGALGGAGYRGRDRRRPTQGHDLRPAADGRGPDRRLRAGVLGGPARQHNQPGRPAQHVPVQLGAPARLHPVHPEPGAVVQGPGAPVDHAVTPVHRLLRPRAARQPHRDAERGLHPDRPREGTHREQGADAAQRCGRP